MSTPGLTLEVSRSAIGAAARLVKQRATARSVRGLRSCCPLVHSSNCSGGGTAQWAPAASFPSMAAVPRLLPRSSCRHAASSGQQGQVVGVESSAVPEERRTKDAIDNWELQEKWGWTTSNSLYWPYKIMRVFSTKNTNALSSVRMLQTCLNNAESTEWYSVGRISNEFLPKLLWLSTNVWLMSRRLLREGKRGKQVQELLFDELWRETKRQMRSIEVSEMMLKKYLAEAQQHTFITLVQYDHAYTLDCRQERMDVLTSALWNGVFMSDPSIKEPHVRVLAEYIDSELADMYAIDTLDFFAVCFELDPPPTAEFKAARKKLTKGGSAKAVLSSSNSSKGKDAALEAAAAESVAAAAKLGAIGERVHHGDFTANGKEGRWRSCLAENGKVYYWHTVSREVTWDKPAGCEPYVKSVMPKTSTAQATTAATAPA